LLLVRLQQPRHRLLHLIFWSQLQLLPLLSLLLLLLPAWAVQLPCLMPSACLHLLQRPPLLPHLPL
jgi:hypothetical protein